MELFGNTEFGLHLRFDVKIFVWIEKDVSSLIILTLHQVRGIQMQFDVRVHSPCIIISTHNLSSV